jgi:hypothetical protein
MPAKKTEKKREVGRPKTFYDLEDVKLLGQFRATHETMAEHFNVSVRTIDREMANSEGEFCQVYKNARATLKMKLSEAQVNKALKGNVPMLIWLGKQHLDQKDKTENTGDRTHHVDSQFITMIQNLALHTGEKPPQVIKQIVPAQPKKPMSPINELKELTKTAIEKIGGEPKPAGKDSLDSTGSNPPQYELADENSEQAEDDLFGDQEERPLPKEAEITLTVEK